MEIKPQGVSSEKGPNTFSFWKRIYCTQFLSYDNYVWFQFVNENSLYTFSGIVHSMSKEQVRGNFDRPCVKWLITRS